MEFLIADTFTDSLGKLQGDEQKQVKTTAFDLQMNLAHPSMQFHKIDRAKDKNFRSVRVSRDLRLIVHKTGESLLLCYVDHHDAAYAWAGKRRLETHPNTGAAQIVVVRETVEEVVIPKYVEVETPQPPLFRNIPRDDLLQYGVPDEWIDDVYAVRSEDALFTLIDHLPQEAGEALLDLATGVTPTVRNPPMKFPSSSSMSVPTLGGLVAPFSVNPFEHPDAKRRFTAIRGAEELKRALSYPWEKWTVFLHPAQRALVERDYAGAVKVGGSAGTGKTIVALHRAVYLARTHPEARVLLTTFSEPLARALLKRVRMLLCDDSRLAERLDVYSLPALGKQLYTLRHGDPTIATRKDIHRVLSSLLEDKSKTSLSLTFLLSEWEHVVDAWGLTTWEGYRDVTRLGRRIRLPESKREEAWGVFRSVRDALCQENRVTLSDVFMTLANDMTGDLSLPYDFAVVDEAQDCSVAQMRFLSSFGTARDDALFFAGDIGQRIFQYPFSWKKLGVSVTGRSYTLRINYRTSHEIRTYADRLLDPTVSDVDGNKEKRREAISVFTGVVPAIHVFENENDEETALATWVQEHCRKKASYHEIGVFVRSENEIDRAKRALSSVGIPFKVLDENIAIEDGMVSLATMHLAKGLEFPIVAVIACDDEVIPSQERIESITNQDELDEVYTTERQLLYVACTRARDHLFVSGVKPASEFLNDMLM